MSNLEEENKALKKVLHEASMALVQFRVIVAMERLFDGAAAFEDADKEANEIIDKISKL